MPENGSFTMTIRWAGTPGVCLEICDYNWENCPPAVQLETISTCLATDNEMPASITIEDHRTGKKQEYMQKPLGPSLLMVTFHPDTGAEIDRKWGEDGPFHSKQQLLEHLVAVDGAGSWHDGSLRGDPCDIIQDVPENDILIPLRVWLFSDPVQAIKKFNEFEKRK